MQAYFEKNEHSYFFHDQQGNNDCNIHFHQNVEIIYMRSGWIEITIRGKTKRLMPGEFAIASSYETHGFITPEESSFDVFIFPADLIPSYISRTENHMLTTPFLERCNVTDELVALADKLISYANRKSSLTAIGLAYTLLGSLIERIGLVPKPKSSQTDTVLAKMLTYINDHFREDLTLIELANQLGYHKSYLSGIFNQGVGYHFNQYVNMLRVRYARQLIVNTAMTLDEISAEAGFQCTRSFRRAFIEHYNQLPHEYKKSHTQAQET